MLPTSLVFNMVTALLLRRFVQGAADALSSKPAYCRGSLGQQCGISTSAVALDKPPSTDSVVSFEQLKAMLSSHSVQLFDVRTPEEYQEGRISGSTNIPLDDLEGALKLTPENFKLLFKVEAPRKEDENIVFHCRSGRRSATALEIAQGLGFTRARHYPGGFSEWAERQGK